MLASATTQLYGLIGSPINHSFSPKMHNTAFEATGVDGCYLAFNTDLNTVEQVIEGLKSLNAVGWNVTMPLKTEMVKYCDWLSPEAKLIGAVNTVVNENGKLKGYSTDGIGFFANAKDNGVDVKDKKLLLLGAGGAARSIAAQAVFEPIKKLTIYNRTRSKAEQLYRELLPTAKENNIELEVGDFEDKDKLKEDIKNTDLLINATSVGMNPEEEGLIIDPDWIQPENIVADIVYTPVKTRLERAALDKGCKILDGLGMVLWQGAYSFKYWTGKEFPVDLVKDKVFNQ